MEERKCPWCSRMLTYGVVEGASLPQRHLWECPESDCDWYEWQEGYPAPVAIGNVMTDGCMPKRPGHKPEWCDKPVYYGYNSVTHGAGSARRKRGYL
jgi:hypothetical protein